MGPGAMSGLPPGFELDAAPSAPRLPAGFELDGPMSKPASEWPLPGSPVAEVGRKLKAAWENPVPDGLISQFAKPVVGLMQAAHGDIPMTGEDGRTNPAIIEKTWDAAKVLAPQVPRGTGIFGRPIATAVGPKPTALESNNAAQNIGVDLPRAISSDSQFTRFMGQVASKMPGGGPMQEGVGNAVRQTGEAVGRAAEMAGGAADAMAAGQGFKSGIETSFKPQIKARIGEAYDAVTKLTDPNVTRPLEATQGAIADIMARRVASGEGDPGKAVQTVLGGIQRPGGLTFAGVKDLRTRVGEMLDTGVFPEGMSQGELRRIYGALSDDLTATATAAGGEKAAAALSRANGMNKFAEEWKDNIGKMLGADRSGEGITAALLRAASEGSAGNLKALTMARAAVPREAWQDVAATAISQLGKDSKGEFSPNIFMNDFAKLSDRGKALLFNDVGSGNVLPHLKDISTVSKKFVEAGKLANTSGTAGHNVAYTMVGAVAAGMAHGSLIEPITAVTAIVGNNLMARALANPASAASIARWSRTYDALASKPAPQSLAAFNIASRNLANTVNSQLGANIQPGEFLKAIQGPKQARPDQDQQN